MSDSSTVVRIGNAQAFWGDRSDAAAVLLGQEPGLDYLMMDYLAEVSMSILAVQQERDPSAGYARDFIDVIRSLTPYWAAGGKCRMITNAGGLNPHECGRACQKVLEESGCPAMKIAVVSGDDVLGLLQAAGDPLASPSGPADSDSTFANLDSGEPLYSVRDRLITANAYMGSAALVEALEQGADIVITGRVADPSLVVSAVQHHFGWNSDDWNYLAGATVAGHLIECGTQVTGGNATDWLDVSSPDRIGFPIIEVERDGSATVTLPSGASGVVNEWTVKEQLLYEIGDPGRYLSPDVSVSFLPLSVDDLGHDRVRVSGASGSPRPTTLKVSATYRDGFRAAGALTICGVDCVEKAIRSGQIVLERVRQAGHSLRDSVIECLGSGIAIVDGDDATIALESGRTDLTETVLRISVESVSKDAAERFSRELMPLITSGPPGTTGYAEGRPRVHQVFRYWPCLVDASCVQPDLQILQTVVDPNGKCEPHSAQVQQPVSCMSPALQRSGRKTTPAHTLADIAIARSGDKGTSANVGVIVRSAADYGWLLDWLTEDRVLNYFQRHGAESVARFELANLHAVNFVIKGILKRSVRIDAQGKTLAQQILQMPLEPK
jgi:Acyclic terpene utilisation family protein AtuA